MEKTPLTDAILPLGSGANPEVQHVALELAGLARSLELTLQRQDALLRMALHMIKERETPDGSPWSEAIDRIEHELGDPK